MAKTARTDAHRPAAIVPANYEIVLSYSLPTSSGGFPVPGFRANCVLDRSYTKKDPVTGKESTVMGEHAPGGFCCVEGLREIVKVTWARTADGPLGGRGKCSVCGSRFTYGDVWKHVPTGEHIHLGHICADKHELMADRSEFELARDRMVSAAKTTVSRIVNEEQRQKFLDGNPGLRAAFKLAHEMNDSFQAKHGAKRAELEMWSSQGNVDAQRQLASLNREMPRGLDILVDISDKLTKFRSLSPKQVAFALKLADDLANPVKPTRTGVEVNVPAPEGRVEFTGVLVSWKEYDGDFGTVIKGTVKVTTPAGVWLAWGTVPASILDQKVNKGDTVKMTATLKRGRDAHFALASRPTGGVVVSRAGKALASPATSPETPSSPNPPTPAPGAI